MMKKIIVAWIVVLFSGVMVAACGGGSSGGSSGSQQTGNVSPGGLWEGVQSIEGEPDIEIAGLVTEDGRFHFLRADGVQAVGSISTDGNQGVANYRVIAADEDEFVDGSVAGTGVLDVEIQERSRIVGTFASETDGGLEDEGTIDLTYNNLYDRDSSLDLVSGIFMEQEFGEMIVVDDAGRLRYENIPGFPTCIADGTTDLIDPRFKETLIYSGPAVPLSVRS